MVARATAIVQRDMTIDRVILATAVRQLEGEAVEVVVDRGTPTEATVSLMWLSPVPGPVTLEISEQ